MSESTDVNVSIGVEFDGTAYEKTIRAAEELLTADEHAHRDVSDRAPETVDLPSEWEANPATVPAFVRKAWNAMQEAAAPKLRAYELALRDIVMLARIAQKRDAFAVHTDHILRRCAEVGISSNILREGETVAKLDNALHGVLPLEVVYQEGREGICARLVSFPLTLARSDFKATKELALVDLREVLGRQHRDRYGTVTDELLKQP